MSLDGKEVDFAVRVASREGMHERLGSGGQEFPRSTVWRQSDSVVGVLVSQRRAKSQYVYTPEETQRATDHLLNIE